MLKLPIQNKLHEYKYSKSYCILLLSKACRKAQKNAAFVRDDKTLIPSANRLQSNLLDF